MSKKRDALLTERFPALRKLLPSRRNQPVPLVQAIANADCGAACLAMVLRYYGKSVRLNDLRDATGTDRDGVSAFAILQAAEEYGLRGRGLRVEPSDLAYLPRGTILHWELKHFVVLEKVKRNAVVIVDPSSGRRPVSIREFRKSFTGVALTFEPADDFQPSRDHDKSVFHYFRRVLAELNAVTKLFVTSLLIRIFLLATPLLTAAVVDRIVPRGDYRLLHILGLGFATIIGFHLLSDLVRAHLLLHLRTHLDVQMTLGFLEHLVSLPYLFFQQRSSGDLMMRVNSNAFMREILTMTTMSAMLDGPMVMLYLLLLLVLGPSIGLLVLALGVLEVLIFVLARRVYRLLMARELHARARADSLLVEMLGGIETLKSLGVEHRAVERWSNLFVDQLNVSISRGRARALVDSLMNTIQMGAPLVILLYGASLVLNQQLSLGAMLGLTALATGFLTPLSKLIASALELQLLKSYIRRLDDVLGTAPEETPGEAATARPFEGRIALEGVSFRYSSGAPLVVRDVSLDIAPGQWVAIVGKSGAGKSTLARLIIGLYRPASGRTLYDGVDLTTLAPRSVRRQIGIVPQTPYLFGGTIRENILFADATRPLEDAVEAARIAAIHDEIMSMPLGYDTLVGDGGSALSAGQRQRVALARALLNQPRLLLLDEATSDLDTINEQRIQENLGSLRCTRVVIAHRLSTIMHADAILVLDEGSIVERGSHEALVERGGTYFELVSAQL